MDKTAERLFSAAKDIYGVKSKTALARRLNISRQQLYNWQIRGISSEGALQVQEILGISATWIRTGMGQIRQTIIDNQDRIKGIVLDSPLRFIETWDKPEDLPEGKFVLLPRREVRLSCGNGNIVYSDEGELPPLAFTSNWVKKAGIVASDAVVMNAEGDSMTPTIENGDILLVDLSRKAISNGKIYGIRFRDNLYVKRLFRKLDGSVIIRSDNSESYPDDIITNNGEEVDFEVIGQVVWRGGSI